MALRLVRKGLLKPDLTIDDAELLIDYYRERNEIARKSHRKRWLRDNPIAAKKLSL